MFGQSFLFSRLTSRVTEAFALVCGADDDDAKTLGRIVGKATGVAMSIATLDAAGGAAIAASDFIDKGPG